jgi:hypothetical protein
MQTPRNGVESQNRQKKVLRKRSAKRYILTMNQSEKASTTAVALPPCLAERVQQIAREVGVEPSHLIRAAILRGLAELDDELPALQQSPRSAAPPTGGPRRDGCPDPSTLRLAWNQDIGRVGSRRLGGIQPIPAVRSGCLIVRPPGRGKRETAARAVILFDQRMNQQAYHG